MANDVIKYWEPSEDIKYNSNMQEYINFINSKYNKKIKSYPELYYWSITEIEDFWLSVWEYARFNYTGKIENILNYPNNQDIVAPGAEWFRGIKFNFADNLLKYRNNRTAIIEYNENGFFRKFSFNKLYEEVSKARQGLINSGVKKGDRVAALISNIPEAIIAMLAVTSLGAVWSSCSPDFGFQGVLDRFMQIRPKVLITVDGYCYNGKDFIMYETLNSLAQSLNDTGTFVIIKKVGYDISKYENNSKVFISWDEFTNYEAEDIEFELCEFGHPVYIMYSSGTTGKPKCIVHGAGGTLIQHYKELYLHTNLKKEDTIFFYTTCGWMMWNWLVSSLNIGAALFLYDGSPVYPEKDILWKAVEEFKINIFGTSPKFLSMCEKTGLKPFLKNELDHLKLILSTGSPLTNNNFKYVYENIKNDVQLSSISGGTDIISCFMLGNPLTPVYNEEIQAPGLGMKIEAWDDEANPQIEKKGELVCTKVFPSMPVFFWNDPENKLYHKSYFDYFPGIWRHGDYIEITERGGIIVYGRSDATLNPGGVRIGTSEIYRVVESDKRITDSIIVSKKIDGDDVIILFVVLKDGIQLNEEIKISLKSSISQSLTQRHVPKYIFQINEIPVTLNGKKVEIAVTKVLNGETITNLDALANPESLDQFRDFKI